MRQSEAQDALFQENDSLQTEELKKIALDFESDFEALRKKEDELRCARKTISAKHTELLRKFEAETIRTKQEIDNLNVSLSLTMNTNQGKELKDEEYQDKKKVMNLLQEKLNSLEKLKKNQELLVQRLKSSSVVLPTETDIECPVCLLSTEKLCAFQCGHIVCENCASKVRTCPICRKTVTLTIQLFS